MLGIEYLQPELQKLEYLNILTGKLAESDLWKDLGVDMTVL